MKTLVVGKRILIEKIEMICVQIEEILKVLGQEQMSCHDDHDAKREEGQEDHVEDGVTEYSPKEGEMLKYVPKRTHPKEI